MPELPEVETVRRGLIPHVEHAIVKEVVIRYPRLRWPIPLDLSKLLKNQCILSITRRGKYLLFQTPIGTLIIHLGMSGRLQIVDHSAPLKAHDHVDFIFSNDKILRYNDARRFGAIVWCNSLPSQHRLLKDLGLEPFHEDFTAGYLQHLAKHRRIAVKPFIMDGHIVVGIGNIYASEALFLAKIHPATPVHQIRLEQWQNLVIAIQQVLEKAIDEGGTTLKDFVQSNGKPGYFAQQLLVYGRAGQPCVLCNTTLQTLNLGQRRSVFCEQCQTKPQ